MEALGALAVAERHILAPDGRSDRGRSDDYGLRPASPTHGSFLPVRQVARGATHASPFQSARTKFVGSATEPSTSRRPVQRDISWRTERARAARVHYSRLSDPYPSEHSERGYVAERPRAARRHAPLLRARSAATRERPEGFQHTTSSAVGSPASERPEGFQLSLTSTVLPPNGTSPNTHSSYWG